MGEEILVKESLSNDMISAGAKLARYLNTGLPTIDAIFWFYLPELNAWRFVVASPEVRALGPKTVYQQIRSVISTIPAGEQTVPLGNIVVVDSHDPLILLLRRAITTGQASTGIRFSRNVINGVLIEDAYIYKLV
ncbi:MAG: hypothetical protein OEW23_17875 [Candidatus Aminicenantes bacterium]|nr:hypothetical protein [Candidatus Aminicenantes bacterium]